jgi:2,4-dienoyl-CoA reductase-like NADH-dependent reductase (Old Yellow Enzyme family)
MQKLVDDGAAQIIAMSRPFIRQPDLVTKLRTDGTGSECTACGLCMVGERPIACYYPRST